MPNDTTARGRGPGFERHGRRDAEPDRMSLTAGDERLAKALGLFSLGLGLAQLAAPGGLARFVGVRDDEETRRLMRTLGSRELASGIGILTNDRPAGWMWGRVAGDAMDLALLRSAMGAAETDRSRLIGVMVAVAGVTMLDLFGASRLGAPNGRAAGGKRERRRTHVQKTLTVNRPVEEVYSFWRDFENFPRFMRHVESVRVIDGRRSRWAARGPAGMRVEWEAAMTSERPNESIAWRSLESSDVSNSGRVTFRAAPGNRGTEVRVEIDYEPPAGTFGRTIAWMFGEEPEQQIREDLRRFKQLIETGEIPVSEGEGLWRSARPAEHADEAREFAGVNR